MRTMNERTVSALGLAHFTGDFILQTDHMALNKSKSNGWLLTHVCWYSIPLLPLGLRYALLNATLHFGVDYVTSRMTSYLWRHERRHAFFGVIGLDQLLHLLCLTWTRRLLARA